MKTKIFKDRMVANDDLIITNPGIRQHGDAAAPHGRLFQVLGYSGNKRVVREIACNTVVVGGAITALENLTGVTANWRPQTLNDIHGISATAAGTPHLCCFGAGTGGASLQFGSVVDPDIKQEDVLDSIPIRYTSAITGDDADAYFMKSENEGGGTYSWFLKEFASTPVIKSCWKNSASADEDGTEILSSIASSTNTEGIETFTELNISLNTNDFREYFDAIGSLSTARYNTFGFYTGAKNSDESEYGDVRLYSVITFNNRDLSISSSATFVYRVYSLI